MKFRLKATLIVILLFGVIACKSENTYPDVSNVSFTLINGKRLTMQELQGRPILVTFWATTCAGCIKEIPALVRLYQQYSTQGLEIIAVAMPYDRPDHVLEFTRSHKLPYPVALDVEAKTVRAFGNVRVTPNNFLIDPDGRISRQHIGILDATETEKWLLTKLN